MADYYRNRMNAQRQIQAIIKGCKGEKIAKNTLLFQVTNNFGFGNLFLQRFLDILEEQGHIRQDNERVWFIVEEKKEEKKENEEEV